MIRVLRFSAVVVSVLMLAGLLASPVAAQSDESSPSRDSGSDAVAVPELVDGSTIPGTGMDDASSGPVLSPVRPTRDETQWPDRNARAGSGTPNNLGLDIGRGMPADVVPGG